MPKTYAVARFGSSALEEVSPDAMHGDRIERIVLLSDRGRVDTHPESDYDAAVFLRDMHDREPELRRLAGVGTEIIEQTGAFVHAVAI